MVFGFLEHLFVWLAGVLVNALRKGDVSFPKLAEVPIQSPL